MQNRLQTRTRRTFDTRKDEMARRDRGLSIPTPLVASRGAWGAEVTAVVGTSKKEARVLVIDNDIRAAGSLEVLLHAGGYSRTRVAYTAHAALGIAEDFRPEIVLMELDMRDIGSDQLSRALCERAQLSRVRLVAVSATRIQPDRDGARTASFERYLLKPITAHDLAACLSEDGNARR